MLLLEEMIICTRSKTLLWLLLLAALQCATTQHSGPVHLRSVKELVLVKGRQASHRRTTGISQLRCSENCESEPDLVKCVNLRSHQGNVEWSCKAQLPPHLEFGKIEVNCEGYDSPEDERVLEGSCGLVYALRTRGNGRTASDGSSKPEWRHYQQQPGNKEGSSVKNLAVLAAAFYMVFYLYRICFLTARRVAD